MFSVDDVNSYFQYVSEVLGAPTILVPEGEASLEQKWLSSFHTRTGYLPEDLRFDLVVINLCSQKEQSLFATAVDELYQKMKSAMKVQDFHVLEVDGKIQSVDEVIRKMNHFIESPYVLIFNDQPSQLLELRTLGSYRILETYGPAHLLQSPEKKKVVWDSLQVLMRAMGTDRRGTDAKPKQ